MFTTYVRLAHEQTQKGNFLRDPYFTSYRMGCNRSLYGKVGQDSYEQVTGTPPSSHMAPR